MTVTGHKIKSLLIALLVLIVSPAALVAAPVLMISIDGLKPEYVTQADQHGLRIPTLRRFMTEGAYADGVLAVLPTVTYPDHTTLITGVWPAEHGIVNNTLFDPEHNYAGAWYWYAGDIRVPTLWDAAHHAGIGTASVSWPVSVNAVSVDTLIPEYWRTEYSPEVPNPQDRELIEALARPVGMLPAMEKRLGPYMEGNEATVDGDRIRTRFSIDILKHQKPGFMTIHISSLDEVEHAFGPFSSEADQTLEAIDGMIGQLINAALKNDPKAIVLIVSDHGFTHVDHVLNLSIPFVQAGLIQLGEGPQSGKVTSWKAMPWPTGGVAAIRLHDPADAATREQVAKLLTQLAADPANGIVKILNPAEIHQMGGFPNAAFVVALKPGFMVGGAFSGPLVSDQPPVKGTHGYLSSFPEMHASFFAMGRGIKPGLDLGVIDMRRIAPTVAEILGVSLPAAKQPALTLNR